MMSTIVILFAGKTTKYMFEPVFAGKSALDMSVTWADSVKSGKIFVFGYEENRTLLEQKLSGTVSFVLKPEWTISGLLKSISDCIKAENADSALYAWADCPFLNKNLTEEIISTHKEYVAEYTYAEGYPYGFTPEMIDGGTAGILASLSETLQKETGDRPVTRSSLFDLIKTDINSFEIETVLAEEDYRLLRYSFECGKKETFISCKALFDSLENKDLLSLDVEKISESAARNPALLKTVPGFYNIQISARSESKPVYIPESAPVSEDGGFMETEKALSLIEKIADFSESAVLSLSYFGDPLFHKDLPLIVEKILSYPGLSVFIETDFISKETASVFKLLSDKAPERTNGYEKIMISVNMDSFTSGTFAKVRGTDEMGFERAVEAVKNAAECFPVSSYPQFIRMNENEEELENFYRYWNEKSNASNGNLIIQKYNSFCGLLPDRKPADLSPVERNVCWHLRRDMNILHNGDVSFCHCQFEKILGNVFEENLGEVWKRNNSEMENHINNTYCEKCGKCDEYYTFNF